MNETDRLIDAILDAKNQSFEKELDEIYEECAMQYLKAAVEFRDSYRPISGDVQ